MRVTTQYSRHNPLAIRIHVTGRYVTETETAFLDEDPAHLARRIVHTVRLERGGHASPEATERVIAALQTHIDTLWATEGRCGS